MGADLISVEVACALPERQSIVELRLPVGTVASEAIQRSGVQALFPELDIAACAKGVWGRSFGSRGLPPVTQYVLQPFDRIEIYRPLVADAKAARRRRAAEGNAPRPGLSSVGHRQGLDVGGDG